MWTFVLKCRTQSLVAISFGIGDSSARMRLGSAGLALLFFFSLASRVLAFDWTVIKHDGRDYIPIADVANFYRFTQADYSADRVNLSGATIRMQGAMNSRELYLNGLKFILSYQVIKVDDKLLISRMDLSKLVEPVLRPAKIKAPQVRTVVLDAGHGGYDQGARSLLGNEKDYALDVVLRARELLTRSGYNVRLTRSGDVFIPLETRAEFASHQSSSIFVSVHFNSGSREDAAGIETYCLAPRGVPATNDLFASLSDLRPSIGNARDPENIALTTAMHAALITRTGAADRGIKRARFVVLRDNNIPGVLIEGGFLTNSTDRLRISTPAYRQLMAQAILQGVQSYNRATQRVASDQMVVKRIKPANDSDAMEPKPSVWDPMQNVYALPSRTK
jgi:N-acetylmuramoyl-L-alanine amidase